MTVSYLDVSELLIIAAVVNGEDPAVRDYGLLASAAHRPKATVFGADAYPELFSKAAALLHSIARNHPLIDGNKRTAFQAASLMLEVNDVLLEAVTDEQEKMMYDVAEDHLDVPRIAVMLEKWSESPER